jgi:hypothetical protein
MKLDALGHENVVRLLFPFLAGYSQVIVAVHRCDNTAADPRRILALSGVTRLSMSLGQVCSNEWCVVGDEEWLGAK